MIDKKDPPSPILIFSMAAAHNPLAVPTPDTYLAGGSAAVPFALLRRPLWPGKKAGML